MSQRPPDNYPRIFVGTGSCGLAAGADRVFDAAKSFVREASQDIHLVRTGCLGMCHREPVLEVHLPGRTRVVYGGVQPEQVTELLARHFYQPDLEHDPQVIGQREPDHESRPYERVPMLGDLPFFTGQQPVLLARAGRIDPHSLVDYEAEGGYSGIRNALALKPQEVIDRVRDAGLRGRGGGGFLTGDKWALAASQPDTDRFVIANGDEGDPGAFSDRNLLESDPHAVIEGLMIAAHAVGATRAFIYTRAAYATAIHRLEVALAFCKKRGYIGDDSFGSGRPLDIQLRKGSGAYICGEETALIASLEGLPPMPTEKPPHTAQRGYMGHPTVVNNVETLATVSHLFVDDTTDKALAATTKLLSLSGDIARSGVVEVPTGTPLRQVIFDIGGGVANGKAFKAVLVGGPDGGFLPESLLDTPVDFDRLKAIGSQLGSGALVVVSDATCMVGLAHYFARFEAEASCGKCVPCRIGTTRLVERLERIMHGQAERVELDTLLGLCTVIRDGSLCGLGRAAPNPVVTALAHFKDDFLSHIDGQCPTGACDSAEQDA
ncbi:MAG: NADH-quinone oxidoreductase subunit F [Nitrospirota bacterium]|nr:NADH-quinone oxidoreductase subunit F [Nitrospirota bacterium]